MLADWGLWRVRASVAAFQLLIGSRFGEFGSQIKARRSGTPVFLRWSTMAPVEVLRPRSSFT